MIYKCFDIIWETDGQDVDLPKEVFVKSSNADFDPSEELADVLSDSYDFLIEDLSYDIIEKIPESAEDIVFV